MTADQLARLEGLIAKWREDAVSVDPERPTMALQVRVLNKCADQLASLLADLLPVRGGVAAD